MSGIEQYSALNVSIGSESVQALMNMAEEEASHRSIVLTGSAQVHDARQPGWMTPAMTSWYISNIAGSRVAAINEINNGFREDESVDGRARSIYLEVERDRVRSKATKAGITGTERFLQAHKDLIDHFDKCREAFSTMKARLNNREPTRTKTWLYIVVLLFLVILEAFINFESFMSVPYITSPFLATGATIAVAIAIAASAHLHGIVLKQWYYLFSPAEPGEQGHASRKKDATRRLVMGGFLLCIALLMVGGSRYYYLKDYILQAQIMGSAAPSMFGGIIFMLFGNMVAFLAATMVAYWMHDAHPIYAERDRELIKVTKNLDIVKRKRLADQQMLWAGMDQEISERQRQDSAAQGSRYQELRKMAAQIDSKDQQILGVLTTYRSRLTHALHLKVESKIFKFPNGAYDELLPLSIDRMLTPEEYAAVPLTLGYTVGEN